AALASDGVGIVQDRVERMAAKGRLDRAEAEEAVGRIAAAGALADLAGAALVIEAVVENVGIKQTLFAALEDVLE
ncbi:3-hydroxyacyl-CoA dehydrogenase NAD-binding domain-containing protein, partial [Streptomyces virginiae]